MEMSSDLSGPVYLEIVTVFAFVFGFSIVRYVLLAARRKLGHAIKQS